MDSLSLDKLLICLDTGLICIVYVYKYWTLDHHYPSRLVSNVWNCCFVFHTIRWLCYIWFEYLFDWEAIRESIISTILDPLISFIISWHDIAYWHSCLVRTRWCLEHFLAARFVLVLFVILEACTGAMVSYQHGASALTPLVNQNVWKGSGKSQKRPIINILARY